jgi:hypothetical protein
VLVPELLFGAVHTLASSHTCRCVLSSSTFCWQCCASQRLRLSGGCDKWGQAGAGQAPQRWQAQRSCLHWQRDSLKQCARCVEAAGVEKAAIGWLLLVGQRSTLECVRKCCLLFG